RRRGEEDARLVLGERVGDDGDEDELRHRRDRRAHDVQGAAAGEGTDVGPLRPGAPAAARGAGLGGFGGRGGFAGAARPGGGRAHRRQDGVRPSHFASRSSYGRKYSSRRARSPSGSGERLRALCRSNTGEPSGGTPRKSRTPL